MASCNFLKLLYPTDGEVYDMYTVKEVIFVLYTGVLVGGGIMKIITEVK
jgi:hypothetical protein